MSLLGNFILHSALDLEELGGRQDANDHRGHSWSYRDAACRKTSSPRAVGSISHG